MPIRSGILSFGLVAIPVKVYPATKDQAVRFNLLHAKCGSRVQNQWFCPVDNEVVPREELVRGAQIDKDQYVQITNAELESLEAEANKSIDLKEFVPLESVDPVYFENSYYLGPDKGGEKPYRLLADALEKMKRVAVAQLVSSGKEQLVLIRPYQNGLILHTAYYADEVRDFGEIPKGDSVRPAKQELELGKGLIDQLSVDEFRPVEFKDEYRLRVLSMLEKKAMTGEEITESPLPARQPGRVIDLMEALKNSLQRTPADRRSDARKKRRKGAS
jgi:DNA end-binding protein Ku